MVVVTCYDEDVTTDELIGEGQLPLQQVFAQGVSDNWWPLKTRKGKSAGEIRVVLTFQSTQVPQQQQPQPAHIGYSNAFAQQPLAPQPSAPPAAGADWQHQQGTAPHGAPPAYGAPPPQQQPGYAVQPGAPSYSAPAPQPDLFMSLTSMIC